MKLMRRVTPEAGQTVNDEQGQPIPAGGIDVVWSTWWQRRLNAGEITVSDPKKGAAK
ncbi:DUF2635 domain-containing protein [Sphingomonas sp. CJ99]